ncbi:para-nitrobenzyl esterase [Ophiostoma piceae UAMH 11346]|uniref:Carboxylic ester hydrolase n=1 Tax=Ophiostoma piceae (strain UAMH 11346) TaxID=1262450 RepID=S3CAA2_OPHP1|nr:para-nitrobenzyl esterase [Ophiostoma piceae UAMH 11346]
MKTTLLLLALAGLAPGDAAQGTKQDSEDLTVTTRTGIFTGAVNANYPDVHEFRNIPYAQPPVGARRWLPPQDLPPSSQHAYSLRWPPQCAQYLTRIPTYWNSNGTEFYPNIASQSSIAGVQAQTSSEDCLSLAIWTPRRRVSPSKSDAKLLPVAIFIPGGDFLNGGVDVTYQKPAPFVSRRQDLIVVTLQYRVDIFGAPNAAGLLDQNLGILDQRKAVEWLHANVRSFGGDPDRMVLWGESAGSIAADFYNYAFYDNPIVTGFFLMSGSVLDPQSPADPTYSNFSFVAKNVGCDFGMGSNRDPDAELACMRQVPSNLLLNFAGQYRDNKTDPTITFRPVPDGRVLFGNYEERAAKGLVADRPLLISTTAHECSSFFYPIQHLTAGPNLRFTDEETLKAFVCPAANATRWRGALPGRTTYRYQYAGNFSSVTPYPWLGAYHGSDIPIMFGTMVVQPGVTAFQQRVSESMQDHLAAFVADPENGLRNMNTGWLPDNGSVHGGPMMRFAAGDKVHRVINSIEVDGACFGQGKYNHSPT